MTSKAAESQQIIKARKKLERKLASEDKRLNRAAIDQMKKAIQIWLTRHKLDRVKLAKKNVELFDENRHSAGASKYIVHLIHKLKKETAGKKSLKTLKGRITQ